MVTICTKAWNQFYLSLEGYLFLMIIAVDELVDQNHLDFVKINKHNNYYVNLPDTPDACAALIL